MKISFFKIAILSFSVSLFSCSELTLPESISVKVDNASFSLPIGGAQFKIADKVSADKMQDALGSDEDSGKTTNIYEYNPTKKDDALVEFIMDYTIPSTKLELTDASDLAALKTTPNELKDPLINEFIGKLSQENGKYVLPLSDFNAKLDTGINFKSIIDSISGGDDEDDDDDDSGKVNYGKLIFNKIGFSNIDSFAYIKLSGIENVDANFSGTISVSDSVEDDAVLHTLTDGNFSAITKLPDFEKLDKGNSDEADNLIECDFLTKENNSDFIPYSVDLNAADSSNHSNNFTNFINGDENAAGELEKHEKCVISYKLSPKLYFEEDALKTFLRNLPDVNVDVNIVIRFPLKLKIISDIEIEDILDLAGNPIEDDLLNREEGDDDPEFVKYLDIIEEMSFGYKFINSTGIKMNLFLSAKDNNGEKLFEDKQLNFDAIGDNFDEIEFKTFSLNKDEINNILHKTPFIPKVKAVIYKTDIDDESGYLSVKRDSQFGLYGFFEAKLNGKVEIWNKNDSDDSDDDE